LKVEAAIPDFEKYVHLFIDSTDFEFTSFIEYPEYSDYGENILFADKYNFKSEIDYSMAADLPVGAGLRIILQGGLWYYQELPDGPVNWTVSQYNKGDQSQIFTSTEPGKPCDLKIRFTLPYVHVEDTIYAPVDSIVAPVDSIVAPVDSIYAPVDSIYAPVDKDTLTIDYYENISDLPTKTKTIIIEDNNPQK